MHLLTAKEDGHFKLVDFLGDDIPPYAVLSHTWGADNEEVTLKDVIEGTGKTKPGYRKIQFCGKQASNDNLQYFWVDTCCIDKGSSAELTEAINSMFRWYHNAVKCYVYLSDIPTGDDVSFQDSRWFTRGWTLQELVAPTNVEFYARNGERIGDKITSVQEISRITGISIQALQGQPLSHFSIDERMSWAERRQTKREEDIAYSLLGLFDVHMPLIYGEGRDKALVRLQKEIQESLNYRWPTPFQGSNALVTRPTVQIQRKPDLFNDWREPSHEHQAADAQQRIIDTLRYPQYQERKQQIHEAHRKTYQWILQTTPDRMQQWDSLTSWLASPTESRRIYWIHGKPGSGKSTMMRFLDENIELRNHMLPWASGKMVIRAHYFFWNPGSKLQKSLTGLLRALLVQLFEQLPDSIPKIVPRRKWNAAQASGSHTVEWTDSELSLALKEFIVSLQTSARVFLLLDGLDELEGSDEAHEDLVGLLNEITSLEHVKVCLSSRPWNIFRDAFSNFPQLKLEDLTRNDIESYVEAQLHGQVRFQRLLQYDQDTAQRFITTITVKASGVFLWVRLVVRELLKGLRDGDGIQTLQKRIEDIPSDLNLYFQRLMDSIKPQQLRHASALLQIALHRENDFASGHPLRLIDLSFIDEMVPDFALASQYKFKTLDFSSSKKLQFHLDSIFRQVNSCCMGLLECQAEGGAVREDAYDLVVIQRTEETSQTVIHAYMPTVDFLHRSCRDFLLTPSIKDLLHQHTSGPFDARMYLMNSRLSQFLALGAAGTGARHAMSIASYLLTALALPKYHSTPICKSIAILMQPTLEKIAQNHMFPQTFWYIDPSIASWRYESSSFLTLAIDFGLDSYAKEFLTSEYIKNKQGRPVLDHVLRPRFADTSGWMGVNSRGLNLKLLAVTLDLGADPNEVYGTASLWALYLCFLADLFRGLGDNIEEGEAFPEQSAALEMLIQAGAATVLPESQLSIITNFSHYTDDDFTYGSTPDERFSNRWRAVSRLTDDAPNFRTDPLYATADIIDCFRPFLGSEVDGFRDLLEKRGQNIG